MQCSEVGCSIYKSLLVFMLREFFTADLKVLGEVN